MIADRVNEVEALIARTHELGHARALPEADVEATGQRLAIAYRHRRARRLRADAATPRSSRTRSSCVYLPGARARPSAGRRPRGRRRASSSGSRDDFDAVPRDMLWLSGDRVARRGLRADRRHARARTLYDMLLPHRDRDVVVGMAACWGSAERFLGLLARTRSGLRRRRRALRDRARPQRRGRHRLDVRMVRDDYTELLDARGETARAEELRSEALGASELPPTEQV